MPGATVIASQRGVDCAHGLDAVLIEAGQKPTASGGEMMIDPNVAAARLRAQTEVVAAQRDLADKQARYTNEHPDVKAAME